MSGQQIGTVVGGAIGAFFGGYPGAQLGMAIGGAIGGAIDPTKVYGPHVGDGQAQSATDGSPISWVMGTMWVAGTIVDVGQSREFKVKQSGGKGGPEQYSYEAHQNFSILVCESDELKGSTIQSVLMIEQDGKIVYDVRPGSTMLEDSAKYAARNVRFYYGDEAQLPLADYDGEHGVGNEPAYRGVLLAFFTQFNVTAAGGRIPSFRFLVATKSTHAAPITLTDSAPLSNQSIAFDTSDHGVAGGYVDMAIPGLQDQIVVDYLNTYILSRVVIVLYYDDPPPVATVKLGSDDPALVEAINLKGAYDSGWVSSGPSPGSDFLAWFTENSLTFPGIGSYAPTNSISPGVVINALPGKKIAGIRKYTFTNVSGLSADAQFRIRTANAPSGITLTYISKGIYLGDDGKYYKTAWSTSDIDGTYDPNALTLSGVVTDICTRGGLTAAQIDVSAFAATSALGYTVAKQMNAVNALGPLLSAYFAYSSEYDGKIHFTFYGADAVMTIDEADILDANDANNGNVTANLRNNATEFPKRITGQYYDPAQNYMPVTVMQARKAAGVTATGDVGFDIPVVMPADQAQQTVDKALKVAYAQLEGTLEFSVPFAGKSNVYLSLVAGDPVLFRGKRWIVTQPIISNGYIKLRLQYDRQSAYTSNVQAIAGIEPTPPQSRYSGPTTLYPMNLPSLRPQDTYGIYLAAKGANDQASWRGCNVLVSYDGQVSWQNALTITQGSTLGTVALAEPTGGEPLTVNVGAETLESVTAAQLAANANAFALINGNTAEIGQFQDAAQQTDGTYQLTTVSRGLNGTTETPATAGQQFTMLDSVYFLPIDLAFAGETLYFRAVGFGEVAEDQDAIPLVYNPDTTIIYDGGEVTGS